MGWALLLHHSKTMRMIFFALILVLGPQSHAHWVDDYMSQLACRDTFSLAPDYPPKYREALIKAYKHNLFRAHETTVLMLENAYSRPPIRIGTIQFKDKKFRILATLGAGGEGVVYVVETPEGLRAIKEFYHIADAKAADGSEGPQGAFGYSGNSRYTSYADLYIYERYGNMVMLEFVLGLPLDIALEKEELISLGLKPSLAKGLAKWVSDMTGIREKFDDEFNSIFDIHSARLLEIDPI
jgi:hypothetical protein